MNARGFALIAPALCPVVAICAGCGGGGVAQVSSPKAVKYGNAAAPVRAFTRSAQPRDAWPGGRTPLASVSASRLVAVRNEHAGGSWRLYLLRGSGQTCLELYGVTGDCNKGANVFSGGPFEIIEDGTLVAVLVTGRVERLVLSTPTGQLPVVLSADKGTLFRCSRSISGSCRGDSLVGFNAANRVVFRASL
jgi:hypothetical protein